MADTFCLYCFQIHLVTKNQIHLSLQDGNSNENFDEDSVERGERRLTELGSRTLEIFVLTHIFK